MLAEIEESWESGYLSPSLPASEARENTEGGRKHRDGFQKKSVFDKKITIY